MGAGKRIASSGAASALVLLCLLALASPLAQATFPGRSGLIVFSRVELHGNGEEVTGGLFAIRPGDDQPQQLTTRPRDYDPSFAPSGKRLVFRRFDDPGSGTYVLDLETGTAKQVASHVGDQSPAFGPKGMIVISRFIDDSYDLVLRTRDGKLRRLTSDDGRDSQPVFTPDGERIVFHRDYRKAVALSQQTPSEREGLYSIRVDGTDLKFLRAADMDGFDLDISPDGRRITSKASFSPDGRKLAYANHEGLWVRRADGKGSPTLLYGADYGSHQPGESLLIQPVWQPLH
jgi:Tol biopolymer transport system component